MSDSRHISPPVRAGCEEDPAVDFGIITALDFERDAVRLRLEDCVQRTFPDDPVTYYEGRVSIPGTVEVYRVVLVMLIQMGNLEAGATVTRLVQKWKPAHLVMIGVAGGVRGKVEAGDVVVGDVSHYYEPGKETATGNERRSRQFPASRMLLGRARAYDATDWRVDIRAGRPVVQPEPAVRPAVRFGPIAAGEKVVAATPYIAELQNDCPQLVAVAMEGAGVALAALNDETRFIEIRGVSDYADEAKSDDGWRPYAADAAAAFLFGFLRFRPVPPAAHCPGVAQAKGRSVLVLCVQSLRTIGPDEIADALDPHLQERPRQFVSLDLTDLVSTGTVTEPDKGVRRLADPSGALLTALQRRAEVDFVFQGLCHIPFAMLVGHLVSDRQPVNLYDFHPTVSNTWLWPDAGTELFPELRVSGTRAVTPRTDEALITVSISYRANAMAARATVGAGTPAIELSVPTPTRGLVRSVRQVLEYGRVFRGVLDHVVTRAPSCRIVHVCYAGPMALAFYMGQQVSENIHPPVVAWNYRQSEGYEWGINLTAARSQGPSVLNPRLSGSLLLKDPRL